MCLSTVYKLGTDGEEMVAQYVSGVQIDDLNLTLTDIMGTETKLRGKIASVDLVKNEIKVIPA